MMKIVIREYSKLIELQKFNRFLANFFTYNVNYLRENRNEQYFDEIMLCHIEDINSGSDIKKVLDMWS